MAPWTIASFDCAEVCKTRPKKYFRIKASWLEIIIFALPVFPKLIQQCL